jgi:site-specific DNA recombinase
MGYIDGGQKRRGNRVVAYIRVSDTTGREDDLISNEVQLHQVQSLAKREGLEIVDVVEDLDMSGRSSKKRSIVPLIARIERGEADGVVVWKISRWGRNLVESLLNINELQRAGGFILSATENLNEIDSAMGRFSLSQMLLIAQLQSDQIGETWANIREYRVSQGKPATGGKRWGYIRHKEGKAVDHYEVDQDAAPWVLKTYEGYVAGLPFTALVDALRGAGVAAPSGREWTTGTLRQTLDTGFAAGLLVRYPRDKTGAIRNANLATNTYAQGEHEPIISAELWEEYREQRASKAQPRRTTPKHELSGLMRCATCGGSMSLTQAGRARDGEPYRYYRCNRWSRHKHSTGHVCPSPAQVRDMTALAYVKEWVIERAEESETYALHLKREQASVKASSDAKRIQKDIDKLEARRKRAYDLLLDGTVDRERWKPEDEAMGAALVDLRARLHAAVVTREVNLIPETAVFEAILQGWDVMSTEYIQLALTKVVRHVEAAAKGDEGRPRLRVVPMWE